MKAVLDLTKAIKDSEYYAKQFEENGTEKNILFVSPQLTSKHLYKFILPSFAFYTNEIHPAITDLTKFNPYEQIVKLQATLSQTEILWANFIVFPFTTDDLSKEYGIYEAIREVNPLAKIVFCVDFNYYEVPKGHPYHELFEFPDMVNQVEKNILLSDLVMVTNNQLYQYLHNKFATLIPNKYKDLPIRAAIACSPYLIDPKIVFQNIEFESQKPEAIINKDIFKKIAEVAEEIKKEDLKFNKDKAIKIESRKAAPKKETPKTKKVNSKVEKKVEPAKRGRKPKNAIVEVEPVIESTVDNNASVEVKEPIIEAAAIVQLPKKYRLGIICSQTNYSDIKAFNEQFQLINEKFGEQVSLIFIGYDYDEDKEKILDGVNFEYVKQISIIHYFKQLFSLELDMIIVPIQKSTFNITSENTNKYLESSLLEIPLFVKDMYPYNATIVDKRNGFIFKDKTEFIAELENILKNNDLIKVVGKQSKKDCLDNYTYTDANIKIMSDLYQL